MTCRDNAIQIFNAAVAAVQPALLIPTHLYVNHNVLHIFEKRFLINALQNIYVIGAGKASAAMAKTVEDILADLITAGIVVTRYGHSIPLQKIICLEAAHPVPDENGVAGVVKTLHLLKQAKEKDIVICLISGGASSLWIDIPGGSSLPDVQETFQLLLNSGAAIDEINTIRKHLSAMKGGQLLRYAPKAYWFSFIIADVPGNDLSIIASGPTVPDDSTFEEVNKILAKYALTDHLPASILQHIMDGRKGKLNDTIKTGDPVFKRVHNCIIGNNRIALDAAAEKARSLGYYISYIDDGLKGDAATVGHALIRSFINYRGTKPACFLLGGETTVTVTGNGKGGRNQQLVLSALLELSAPGNEGFSNRVTFLSAGTDGSDGPTDAAGAIADRQTLAMAVEMKLDAGKYLQENDAYHFFEKTGGLIITGATQTNVMDIVVAIVE